MSKRKQIKAEEKIHIAEACIYGTISINAAAEQLGVHKSVVDDWVRLYQTEGVESFLPRKENRRYAPMLKEAAVKDYLSGRGSLREIGSFRIQCRMNGYSFLCAGIAKNYKAARSDLLDTYVSELAVTSRRTD